MSTTETVSENAKARQFNRRSTAMQVLEGVDLNGKTMLITGANTGLGFQTARALAKHGAHVVMACRNLTAAEEAKQKILSETATSKIDILELDCGKLHSVEECAKKFLEHNWPLHVLILNAGVHAPPARITPDGFETTFQVNHLSQFYLTTLLEQKLISSAPSRVVVVASLAHHAANITERNITKEILSPKSERMSSSPTAYALSKFCNILFASELNRRLHQKHVTAYSVHPGIISTGLTRNSGLFKSLYWIISPLTPSEEQGAATMVLCATDPRLEKEGGKYFTECKEATPSRKARSAETAKKLWEISEEMLNEFKGTKQ